MGFTKELALADMPSNPALVLPAGKIDASCCVQKLLPHVATRLSRWCRFCQWGLVFCTRSHIACSCRTVTAKRRWLIRAPKPDITASHPFGNKEFPALAGMEWLTGISSYLQPSPAYRGAWQTPAQHVVSRPGGCALFAAFRSSYLELPCLEGPLNLRCTPVQGRLIDHLRNTQSVGLEDLQALVLDEADRLLQMGFAEEVGSSGMRCKPTQPLHAIATIRNMLP